MKMKLCMKCCQRICSSQGSPKAAEEEVSLDMQASDSSGRQGSMSRMLQRLICSNGR